MKQQWCITSKNHSQFICRMEDVLNVYHRSYDPDHPVVCMDESTKQQIKETQVSIPMKPGHPERIDHEYERNGVGHLFMFSEPKAGRRFVEIRDQHTKKDWVECMRKMAEEEYPLAKKITIVMDNLATHAPESFYEYLPAAQARTILDRLEFHFTPKHGSWLNMAEIEFACLNRECLDRRIPDRETLVKEVSAWQSQRNRKSSKIDWQFTTADARIKLKRLYPVILSG